MVIFLSLFVNPLSEIVKMPKIKQTNITSKWKKQRSVLVIYFAAFVAPRQTCSAS